MVTLMRFNMFLIFALIFTYIIPKTYKYTKESNIELLDICINIGYILSFIFIASLTILPITTTLEKTPEFNIIPLKTILLFLKSGITIQTIANIGGNIVLFVPLGYFAYIKYNKNIIKTLSLCISLTILVETIQIILPMRLTDIDDIILNTLGGIIGIIIAKITISKTTLKKALKRDI